MPDKMTLARLEGIEAYDDASLYPVPNGMTARQARYGKAGNALSATLREAVGLLERASADHGSPGNWYMDVTAFLAAWGGEDG